MILPDLLEQTVAFQAICHHSENHLEDLAMFEKQEAEFTGK